MSVPQTLSGLLRVLLLLVLAPLVQAQGGPPPSPDSPSPVSPSPVSPSPGQASPGGDVRGDAAKANPVTGDTALSARDLPGVRYPIQWRRNWRKALLEAKERNVPILLTVHRDGERIGDATRSSLWPDRGFMDIVDDECVPVVVILPPEEGTPPHAEVSADPEKGVDAHCPLVPTMRCADHRALRGHVPEEFCTGEGRLPERRLLAPDGRVLVGPEDLPPGMNATHLAALVPKIRAELGERRATRVQYHFALVRLERMAEGISIREFRAPSLDLKAFRRTQDQLPPALVARADALEGKIRAEAKRMLDRALSVEERNPTGAQMIFKVLCDEFPGTPEGDIARRKLAGLPPEEDAGAPDGTGTPEDAPSEKDPPRG